MRASRTVLVGLALIALVAAPSVATAAGSFTLGAPVAASGASPFAACTVGAVEGADPPSINYPDTEIEPFVAVNPVTDHIVGVYQQDRWSDGGAHGLVASRSDTGAAWTQNYGEFSVCSNYPATAYTPPFNRATDPWVSFDSAGKAYQISLGIQSANLDLSGVEVATSDDDGATWGAPVRLITSTDPVAFNDKQSITGDWRPVVGKDKAYATWIVGHLPGGDHISPNGMAHSFAYSGRPVFSKTTDGGATWSTPKPMTNAVVFLQGNQIVVLPDGTLVNVGAMLFRGSGIQPTPTQYFWAAMVSTNGGKTWGAPIKIAPLGTQLLTNPDIPNPTTFDETVRAGDYIPDVAVDHATGAIYMVFADGISTGFNHVKLTKSTDGGKNWSTPKDVTTTPTSTHSFNQAVEVTSNGTVAVSYYDFRKNDATTRADGLPTDVWLTESHDGGATWSEQHAFGSFDMEHAPLAGGWFLGDYQGLATIDRDVIMFFSVSTAAEDSAEILAIRATAP
jgi:hypothetical protein